MNAVPRVLACLFISSTDIDPTEITARLGVELGRVRLKGERRASTQAQIHEHEWKSPYAPGDPFDLATHIEGLLHAFGDGEALRELARESGVEVTFLVGVLVPEGVSKPAIHFPASLLLQVGEIGASIDVDIV